MTPRRPDPTGGSTGATSARRSAGTRALAGLAIVAALLLLTATPASAHGVGGLQPSNYETTVDGLRPPVPGIHVRAVDFTSKIELRNDTNREVTVVGYQNEPYLRIGPRGVWQNARSPAVFLNRSQTPTRSAPHDQYDPEAKPQWVKVSSAPVRSWHDHRTHLMTTEDPPIVQRDPGSRHVVIANWKIPVRDGGRRYSIVGDASYIPPASPWPWVVGGIVLAGGLVLLCRTKSWSAVMQAALLILIVSETIHVVGAWQASTDSLGSRLLGSIYSIGGIAVCLLALWWLRRRDAWAGAPAVLIAGLFVFVAGGLADFTTLTKSQVPTTLPDGVARLTVTIALGLGLGLVIAAGSRLRAPPPPRRSEPTPPVPTLVP
jgi:hypothetical protein